MKSLSHVLASTSYVELPIPSTLLNNKSSIMEKSHWGKKTLHQRRY